VISKSKSFVWFCSDHPRKKEIALERNPVVSPIMVSAARTSCLRAAFCERSPAYVCSTLVLCAVGLCARAGPITDKEAFWRMSRLEFGDQNLCRARGNGWRSDGEARRCDNCIHIQVLFCRLDNMYALQEAWAHRAAGMRDGVSHEQTRPQSCIRTFEFGRQPVLQRNTGTTLNELTAEKEDG